MEITTAQTIGELIEGQRQTNGRLDRLEGKVDKLLWVGFGIIGAVVAALITALATLITVVAT